MKKPAKYRQIVYLLDDDAAEGLGILKHEGKEAAFRYLMQWDDKPGKLYKQLVCPGNYFYVGDKNRYIVFYDPYAAHIGLTEVLS